MLDRFPQFLLIVSLVVLSWLLMQVAHEAGHVLAAWESGAKIERVVLHPLTFSRTDLSENPKPLFVYWSGAVFGILFPLLLLAVLVLCRMSGQHLLRFFAGFCFVANGAYLGFDFSEAGPTDAGLLIEHGASRYQLLVFGVLSIAFGLFLWHRQSKYFGFGQNAQPVSGRIALIVFASMLTVVALEIIGCYFAELR